MNKDEQLKTVVDTFGKLSFLLETAVKLHQTGDCAEIKNACLGKCQETADELVDNLDKYNNE